MNFKSLLPYRWRKSLKRHLCAVQDMNTRLANLRRAGFAPTGAIDGGAYRGDWTRAFWHVYPMVPVLLVEPQERQFIQLQRLARNVPGLEVISVALWIKNGFAQFRLSGSGSRITSDTGQNTVQVETKTLARILHERPTFTPNLLKLDLQGYELQALEGLEGSLGRFEVIILEISILRIGNVPIFHEVDTWMETHQLRLYDLIPQYYRPRDGALWQIDAFYVRHDSALLASRSWA